MTDAADDFDALFEEVSSQRSSAPVAAPAAAPAAADEDDMEALFDQVASTRPVLAAVPAPAAAAEPVAAAGAANGEVDHGDNPMYERLGGIVRLLHDSLRELGYDKALTEASSQINDAQDRLEYVASLTEQAANKVLNTLDEGMPAQDVLSKQAREMDNRWNDLFAGKLSIEQFKALAGDSRQFAQQVAEATEAEKARLLDIMMAQDFQDLTGQVITRVTTIAQNLEQQLVQLLVDFAPAEVKREFDNGLLNGPQINPVGQDVVSNQGQVDDLLDSLGF